MIRGLIENLIVERILHDHNIHVQALLRSASPGPEDRKAVDVHTRPKVGDLRD